jgi:site-specific recombinase XerD
MTHEQLIHLKPDLRFTLTSLQLALDSFLLDAEARHLTPKTIRYYRQQIQPFLDSLNAQGVITPEAITAHHIRLGSILCWRH